MPVHDPLPPSLYLPSLSHPSSPLNLRRQASTPTPVKMNQSANQSIFNCRAGMLPRYCTVIWSSPKSQSVTSSRSSNVKSANPPSPVFQCSKRSEFCYNQKSHKITEQSRQSFIFFRNDDCCAGIAKAKRRGHKRWRDELYRDAGKQHLYWRTPNFSLRPTRNPHRCSNPWPKRCFSFKWLLETWRSHPTDNTFQLLHYCSLDQAG